MTNRIVRVIENVWLLAPEEGGYTEPVRGSYRPNHNFFGADVDEARIDERLRKIVKLKPVEKPE